MAEDEVVRDFKKQLSRGSSHLGRLAVLATEAAGSQPLRSTSFPDLRGDLDLPKLSEVFFKTKSGNFRESMNPLGISRNIFNTLQFFYGQKREAKVSCCSRSWAGLGISPSLVAFVASTSCGWLPILQLSSRC